mmetsp:Transcript_39203/g.83519  ORF Transcript_39203/g.83519 Transcript_39203/m.83519 type:complete len:496 (+) Transcript_39203:84-1571(+)
MMAATPSTSLYVKGLVGGTQEETIRALFGIYGQVARVKILPNPEGVTDVAAIVQMSNQQEASYIVENTPAIVTALGLPLQIQFAAEKGAGKGGAVSGMEMMVPNMMKGQSGKGMGMVPGGSGKGIKVQSADQVYIKGLPLGTTSEQLQAFMSSFGTVARCKMLPLPENGGKDCHGIVQMASPAEAKFLVDNLDGKVPDGLQIPLRVQFKFECPPPAGAQTSAPIATMSTMLPQVADAGEQPTDSVYMSGLPADSTPESLKTIFDSYGTVKNVKLLQGNPGRPEINALVQMTTNDEAQWLVDNVSGNIPQGLTTPVAIKLATAGAGAGKGGCMGKMGMMGKMGKGMNAWGGGQGMDSSGGAWGGNQFEMMQNLMSMMWGGSWNGGGMGKDGGMGKGSGGGKPAGPAMPSDNLYVKGFHDGISDEEVRTIMNKYGKVNSCRVLPTVPGRTSGTPCLVRMSSIDEAKWIVENLNGNIPEGHTTPIEVKFATKKTYSPY